MQVYCAEVIVYTDEDTTTTQVFFVATADTASAASYEAFPKQPAEDRSVSVVDTLDIADYSTPEVIVL